MSSEHSMGKVSAELLKLLTRQIKDYGIVVWYDPERDYKEFVKKLTPENTRLVKYEGSFLKLRDEIDPFLEFVTEEGTLEPGVEAPPRVLVYVPMARSQTHHALVEAEAAGVIVEPGANPWQRNTRLKVLAQRAFQNLPAEQLQGILKQVEKGLMTLAELDRLAEQKRDISALKLVFDSYDTPKIILEFLISDRHDPELNRKQLLPELAEFIRQELGLPVPEVKDLPALRAALSRQLLMAELKLSTVGSASEAPAWRSLPVPKNEWQRKQLLEICSTWRNRFDLQDSYQRAAEAVEQAVDLKALKLEPEALYEAETFAFIEDQLQTWALELLRQEKWDRALAIARGRRNKFWARVSGTHQAQWSLIENIAQLFSIAVFIEDELKKSKPSLDRLVKAYTLDPQKSPAEEGSAWYLLDHYYRRFEYWYAKLDIDTVQVSRLEQIIQRARQRYLEVVSHTVEKLTDELEKNRFNTGEWLRQREIFSRLVRSALNEGKVAYMLVDALRYDIAAELCERVAGKYQVRISPALAQLPTITEVGMASLLCDAEDEMELLEAKGGRLAVSVGDMILKDRSSRIKFFQAGLKGVGVDVLKLNDLMKPDRDLRSRLADAELVLITSQELDRRGEEMMDEEEARRFMDDIINKIEKGVRRLAEVGVHKLIISADHGHLFMPALGPDRKLEPPGGTTVALHPRVWIGRGGGSATGHLRVSATQIGLKGDLELVFPRGLGCFVTRGPDNGYFHGGISLQEMVIPVISAELEPTSGVDYSSPSVTLKLAKPKITNRFFTVEVLYQSSGLFGSPTKRVKVVVRAGEKEIGETITANYGFIEEPREVELEKERPNILTIMLSEAPEEGKITLQALDASTQIPLSEIPNIPVELML